MFDKLITTHVKTPDHVSVKVDMPRPDVAEFTRLANEMKLAAEKEVSTVLVKKYGATNHVTVLEVRSEKNYENMSSRARVKFDLNGELYDTEFFDFETDVYKPGSRHAVEAAIMDEIMRQVLVCLRRKL